MFGSIEVSANEWIMLNRIISVKIAILVTTSMCANKWLILKRIINVRYQ